MRRGSGAHRERALDIPRRRRPATPRSQLRCKGADVTSRRAERHPLRSLTAILGLCLSIVACGDDDDSAGPSESTNAVTSAETKVGQAGGDPYQELVEAAT